MRRILTTLTLVAAAAALPAYADDSRLVTSVKLLDIQTILTEEGHQIMSTGNDGEVSVRAKNADGLIFNIIGTACDTEYADGCLGLNMQVRYNADGNESLDRINGANLMWGATSSWYAASGFDGDTPTVGISRYVILDRGVTAGNIKDNLINLLAIAPRAANYIWEVGEYAPGAEGEYDDEGW